MQEEKNESKVKMYISFEEAKAIPEECIEWVKNNAPSGINEYFYIYYFTSDNFGKDGIFPIYIEQDRTNDKALYYEARSLDEVKYFLLQQACWDVGYSTEFQHRKIEQLKWRYYKETVRINGRLEFIPRENKTYQYGVEYDSRKWNFEFILKCLKTACSEEYYKAAIVKYEALMNISFDDEHWKFDEILQEFIEVSNSVES